MGTGDGDHGPDRPAAVLRRWQASGGIWRVAARSSAGLELELVTCTGDEVVGRLRSGDLDLVALVGDRASSEEAPGPSWQGPPGPRA